MRKSDVLSLIGILAALVSLGCFIAILAIS